MAEQQLSMFDTQPDSLLDRNDSKARARRSDPASSHAAAAQMNASGATDNHVERVKQLLEAHPGSTAHELAKYSQLDPGLELTQVQILRRLKKIPGVTRGETEICPESGRPCVTWWRQRI